MWKSLQRIYLDGPVLNELNKKMKKYIVNMTLFVKKSRRNHKLNTNK